MFEYTRENLRKLQLVELEMLVELDRLCRKHNIKYIIDAGTLLGAVRHNGFIPWDDDIDIRMLRSDYDKFCQVCKQELAEEFFLQNHDTDSEYMWGYARILRKDTKYVRVNHEAIKSKTGIFIDIFPNDTLPDNCIMAKVYTILTWLCRKMLYSGIGKKYGKSLIDRIGFYILDLLPKEGAHIILRYLVNLYRDSDSQKVRCYGWGSKEETKGFQRGWLENTTDISFEGRIVRAPIDTVDFLIFSFGKDYMTPPPESKRVPGHLATEICFPNQGREINEKE